MATSRNRMWPFQIDRISCFSDVAQTSVCVSNSPKKPQTEVCATGLDTNAGIAPAFSQALIGPSLAQESKGEGIMGQSAHQVKAFITLVVGTFERVARGSRP